MVRTVVLTYVDDFNLAGNPEFIDMMTKYVRKALDVSKVEDGAFLFMGFDMKQLEDEIEIPMKEYMK